MADIPDYLILGAGMAGLSVAALLAHAGHTVRVLEAHEFPGGYAHSFPMGQFRLCAQVHYIFGCEEGGSVRNLVRTLGLEEEVEFLPLDPDGYDQVDIHGDRYRIPNGFTRHRENMMARFPQSAMAIEGYFDLLIRVRDELERLPERHSLFDLAAVPFRSPHLLRYRHATLQAVFDAYGLPVRAQAVLAGQAGDYLLPPNEVSFLLHVALVAGYDRGAWYPKRHYGHFVDSLAASICSRPGCCITVGEEVSEILLEGGRVSAVLTANGHVWKGRNVISNMDPRRTAALLGSSAPKDWRNSLNYKYSCSSFTMYLGLKGIDLRAHGFGRWNTWYYPDDNINRIYADQCGSGDLSNPWLFLSTPSLHSDAPGLAPSGHDVLTIATACSYEHFSALKAVGSSVYNAAKLKVRDRILDIVEERYLPGLREHIVLKVVGSPTTNARFCWSPDGNAYGAALTPDNVGLSRIPFATPIPNLYLCNATAGYPSVAGTVRSGQRLFSLLQAGAL